MQVKFELATYDEELDKFELDEHIYLLELNDEQTETYEFLKDADLDLYNWFKKADFFLDWIREEIYPNNIGKKFVICDIDKTSFRRFYFFKVTSGDVHYEYFKKLFGIIEESDWQDREDVGREILEKLLVKRQKLVMELQEMNEEPLELDNDREA